MKLSINKNKNSKKTTLIVLAVLLLLVGLVATLELTRATDFIKNPFYRPSAEEIEQKRIDEANKADETRGDKEDVKTDPNVDGTKSTSDIPIQSNGSISVETLSQANGIVVYKASVSSNLSGEGTCSITFSNVNARPITRTLTASNRQCGPVEISENEFSTLGEWQVTLRYYSDNMQVVSTETLEIK